MLVLAGTDRLDKELMIGQMQGKFQLVVVPDTGHMIHEVSLRSNEIFDDKKSSMFAYPGQSDQISGDSRGVLET